jgi:hypothetical protein
MLLLICSFFDLFYNSKVSENVNHFYKYEHLKIISIFTFCSFFSRKLFFKDKFYSHHYLSLLIMIIIFPIELFYCFISREKKSRIFKNNIIWIFKRNVPMFAIMF